MLGILFLLPEAPRAAFPLAAALVGAAGLFLVARLNRTYVGQLADNLRRGVRAQDRRPAQDAPTQAVAVSVAETHVGIDRVELLARLRQEARERGEAEAPDLEAVFEQIRALVDPDPEVARRALSSAQPDPRLVPFVLPLLERFDSVYASAVAFLRTAARGATGQLVDALLDPEGSTLVRRRIPRVLGDGEPTRALAGLQLALDDDDFEIRTASARAAARLVAASPRRRFAREFVHPLVGRELAVSERRWEQQSRPHEEHGDALDSVIEAPPDAGRSVEHIFTLFALSEGPELMGSTLRALYGRDPALHGTALEYLETTLPQELRAALWPRLPDAHATRRSRRKTGEIAEELLRAAPAAPTVRVREPK